MHRWCNTVWFQGIFAALFVGSAACLGQAAEPLRTYHIGNSLTEGIQLWDVRSMALSRGDGLTYGRHVLSNASLEHMWNNPGEVEFTNQPYGAYQNALSNYQWDAITLQPFSRPLNGPTGDRTHAANFINYARHNSPDAQFYVYAQWPTKNFYTNGLNYDAQWLQPYSGGNDDTVRTRDYYEQLTVALRQDLSDLEKPVLLVPVGHVLHELHQRMKAGDVPGFTDIGQFYGDFIHLNELGKYAVSVTFYATMFKDDPRGLPYDTSVITDPLVAQQIQDAAWQVVSTHPMTGVPEPTSAIALAALGSLALIRRRHA